MMYYQIHEQECLGCTETLKTLEKQKNPCLFDIYKYVLIYIYKYILHTCMYLNISMSITGFGWDRVNFLRSGLYGATF